PRRTRRRERRRRSGQLRLLAALRHRRLLVHLLWGNAALVSAGHGAIAGDLDWNLPQSGRRQGLRHLVQRLLRQARLRLVFRPPQSRRQADLLSIAQQRHQLVLRHDQRGLQLLNGDRRAGQRMMRSTAYLESREAYLGRWLNRRDTRYEIRGTRPTRRSTLLA